MVARTMCSAPDQKLSHLPPGRYKVIEDDKSYTVPLTSLNKVFFIPTSCPKVFTIPC